MFKSVVPSTRLFKSELSHTCTLVVDFGDLITKIYQSHGGCPLDSRLQTFDINNDDIDDLAVSTAGDDAGGSRRGIVHIMFNGLYESMPSLIHESGTSPVARNLQYGHIPMQTVR